MFVPYRCVDFQYKRNKIPFTIHDLFVRPAVGLSLVNVIDTDLSLVKLY